MLELGANLVPAFTMPMINDDSKLVANLLGMLFSVFTLVFMKTLLYLDNYFKILNQLNHSNSDHNALGCKVETRFVAESSNQQLKRSWSDKRKLD